MKDFSRYEPSEVWWIFLGDESPSEFARRGATVDGFIAASHVCRSLSIAERGAVRVALTSHLNSIGIGTESCDCVLCGAPIDGHGNNPEPLAAGGRCCNDCNSVRVIPARMFGFRRRDVR